MAVPLALFASCSDTEPLHIIKQILQDSQSIEGSTVVEDIIAYPWCIDTRYFTAEIELCCTKTRTIGDATFAERLEAFIVHIDTKENASLEKVKLWLPFVKEIEPEICLLVCNRCADGDAVTREKAWKWCLENSFELVELDPLLEENSDEEDDFKETTGIKRIIQALHAHTWPNLKMKEKPSFRSSLMTQMMRDEAKAKCTNEKISNKDETTNAAQNNVQHSSIQIVERNEQESFSAPKADTLDTNITEKTQMKDQSTLHSCEKTQVQTVCDVSNFENPFLDSIIPQTQDSAQNSASSGFEDDFGQFASLNISDTAESIKGNAGVEDITVVSNSSQVKKSSGTEQLGVGELVPEPEIGEDQFKALSALGSEDTDPEAFEDLFEKLKVMKEQAEHLPLEQRKLYAEKVAIQFWKAIGGDDDEIEGLSSDENI